MWVIEEDGQFREVIANPRGVRIDGISHGATTFTLWSEAELNAIGVFIATVDSIPEGHIVLTREWVKEGNRYREALTTEMGPPPEPAPLTAEELHDMLVAAGTPMGPRPRPKRNV